MKASKKQIYIFFACNSDFSLHFFYLLGSQNAVRQYFAFIISFIGFLYLLNNKKLISLFLFVLSMTFHKMIVLYFPLYFLIKMFKNQKLLIYLLVFWWILIYTILVTILSDNLIVQFYISFQDKHFQKEEVELLK